MKITSLNVTTGEEVTRDMTPEEIAEVTSGAPSISEQNNQIRLMREVAFKNEADPLYFKEQRGEVPEGTWQAKISEIRSNLPYIEE